MPNVAHVPLLGYNLLSLKRMADRGHKYVGEKKGVALHLKNGKIMFGPSVEKLNYFSGFKLVKSIRVDHSKVFHGVYTLVNEYNQVVLRVGRFCQNTFFVHGGGSRALCQWMSVAVARRVDAGIRPMRRGEGVGQTSK